MSIGIDRVARSSLDRLMSELTRIDIKLRSHVKQASTKDNYWANENVRGLYVSEAEISDLLANGPLERDLDNFNSAPRDQFLDSVLSQVDSDIRPTEKDCPINKEISRLEKLIKIFNLSPFEMDVLLLSLLPDMDLKYERIFGYVQDDITRRKPSVALALDILCKSYGEKLSRRRYFAPGSALIINSLIYLVDDNSRKSCSQLGRSLVADERIRDYLFGFDDLDASLSQFTKVIKPHRLPEELVLPRDLKDRLPLLIHKIEVDPSIIFYFRGAVGSGKKTIAEAISHKLGRGLMVADAASMVTSTCSFDRLIRLLCREAQLQDLLIYLDNFDILFEHNSTSLLKTAMANVTNCPNPIIFAGSKAWSADHTCQNKHLVEIEIPPSDYKQRKDMWHMYLDSSASIGESVVDALATKFRLNSGQIRESYLLAKSHAVCNDVTEVNEEDLYQACRTVSNQKLADLAQKIVSRYVWEDIVLPAERMQELREIYNHVKYRHIVYGEWGFDRKISRGNGLNVLFAGASGTGKTMAVEIMANELKLDLYKIDLSSIVSKYIGETEKNLNHIFKEAQDSNSILFFDEADSLFGKRSEVRDSHDRYANIEIAYLLQKMEDYEGIVILATNLGKNIDEAFARRMHFVMEFPSPNEDQRLKMWQKVFPPNAPICSDVDLPFMARQFRISGGNIRNIALAAAFLAASNKTEIRMKHLILAMKREYQKIGKMCTEIEFLQFYEHLNKQEGKNG
jgi:SpoVK/Ycf46/Vps4 family AAA+-type ATPase